MGNKFEKMQLEKKDLRDFYLDRVIANLNDFKKFYESAFVKDTSNEKYGFSEQEQEKMLKLAEELKRNMLNECQKNEKLLVSGNSQFMHLFANSLTFIGGYAIRRYERGELVPEETKRDIKERVEFLNCYIQELVENKELMKDEIAHENGYLQKFSKYLKKERISDHSWIILLLKFFRDLETRGISENDFHNRLLEMDERVITINEKKETMLKNCLDIQKLERDLVKKGNSKMYKFI